jgi:LPXTG-site transpeptidase (sortase) family protein
LTQASIADTLPANLFLANPVAPTLTNCGGAATLTAVSGGTTVTLNTATIAPVTTCTIHVNVISNTQATYRNTIPANRLQDQENISNASPASATLNVQAVGMTKAFLPTSVAAGGTTTLTITLQNPTGAPYTGAAFTDTLPAGLNVASAPASPQCGGTITSTLTSIHLAGGTIPAGSIATPGTCTITVQVIVPPGTPSGTATNTIPAGALTTTQGVTNLRPATATVTIAGSDLRGIKTFTPASIPAGGNSRLRLDFFAPGDTNLTNFSVTDNLPLGVTVSNSTAPAISGCGAAPPRVLTAVTGSNSISLTGGVVLAGQRCRIDVFVTGSTAAVYTNTIPPANVTDNEGRVPASSLTSNLTVTSQAGLSLALVKGFNPLTVFGGSASTMSVQLINPQNVPLTGIAFSDNMPAGMIIANPANPAVGTCGGAIAGAPGAGSFSFSGGSLPANGTCTLTLSITMTVNGNLTNTIPAGAVTTLQGASNPQPAAASLTNLPGASVSKVFSPNPIAAGLNNFSLLTITVQNTGTIPLDGMGLSDTLPGNLPAGLQIAGAPAPAPTNSCGGTLTAVTGQQTIQLSGGSLAASASCSIVVGVTSTTPGSYQNDIPAGALSSNQGASNRQPATDTLVVTGANTSGINKIITATNQPSTTGTQVTIGEIVTYQTSVPLAPGTYDTAQLIDTMDKGLAFVDCVSIDGTGLSTTIAGGFSAVCANPTVQTFPGGSPDPTDVDRRAIFDFGTLTNAGANDATLTVTYRAVVLDSLGNVDGANLNNSASFLWTGGSLGPGSAAVQIIEPKLSITKTSNNSFVAVGSDLAFTLTVSHIPASLTNAFDVSVTDALPIYLDFVPGSLDCTTGTQNPGTCTYDNVTRTITATWSTFAVGGGVGVILFHVIPNSLPAGNGAITNTGLVAWSSLPGNFNAPQSFTPNVLSTERFYDPLSQINVYGANAALTLTPLGGSSGGGGNGNGGARGSEAARRGAVLIPITGFAPGKFTDLSGLPVTVYDASGNLTLDIPKLTLKMPIVGVALNNGTWDVNWLLDRAGWLEKTAFPTFTGNSVVTGHVTLSNGDPGPFARLSTLSPGDEIFVHAFGQLYVYQVRTIKTVKPDDISIFQHEDKAWLSLVTCGNYDAALGVYLNRTVVRAELISTLADPYLGQ